MTDVIVIGSGVAGLSAALSAAEAGARVTVVTKAALDHTATDRAQAAHERFAEGLLVVAEVNLRACHRSSMELAHRWRAPCPGA